MRLVTYDRGGQRRLGAILEGEVVDLPDAVGHPAFPTTLEGLVTSSRGTVLDAARAALERDDAREHLVRRATILAPLFPESLLAPGSQEVERRIVGPEREVPWPANAAWLEYEPRIAAIIAVETSRVDPEEAERRIFGYTLVNDWVARDASGDPAESATGVPIGLGPCVVTADEIEPQRLYLRVRVDEVEVDKGNLNGAARSLFGLVSAASRIAVLGRGDAVALGPFERTSAAPRRRVWPGAVVELSAEGIGTLRTTLSARP